MKKLIFISLILVIALGTKRVLADVEAPGTVIDKTAEVPQTTKDKIQTEYALRKKQYAVAKQGFQKAKEKYNQAKEMADNIQEAIENPLGAGVSLAQKLHEGLTKKDISKDELAQSVKATYSREENAGIEAAVAHQKATNLLLIDNTAALFAKAMVLRQNINDEELDEPDIENIETAMRLSTALMVKSLERWNEILKMRAYISAYKNFLENQNYKVEEDEEAGKTSGEAENEK